MPVVREIMRAYRHIFKRDLSVSSPVLPERYCWMRARHPLLGPVKKMAHFLTDMRPL